MSVSGRSARIRCPKKLPTVRLKGVSMSRSMRQLGMLALAALAAAGLSAADAVAQTGGAVSGGWTYFGGTRAFTRYAPLDQIDRTNVAGLRVAWRRPAVDASFDRPVPRARAVRLPAVHPDPRRRRPLRIERGRARRGVRSRHGRDPLAPAAAPADPGGGRGPRRPRRRVLVRRRRPPHLRVPQPVPVRPRRRDRGADPGVRRRRPCRPDARGRPKRTRRGEPHRRRRRGRGGGHGGRGRRQRGALARQRPGERAGLRRADRRAAVDLPRGAAAGRVRRRHLGRRGPSRRRATSARGAA